MARRFSANSGNHVTININALNVNILCRVVEDLKTLVDINLLLVEFS